MGGAITRLLTPVYWALVPSILAATLLADVIGFPTSDSDTDLWQIDRPNLKLRLTGLRARLGLGCAILSLVLTGRFLPKQANQIMLASGFSLGVAASVIIVSQIILFLVTFSVWLPVMIFRQAKKRFQSRAENAWRKSFDSADDV